MSATLQNSIRNCTDQLRPHFEDAISKSPSLDAALAGLNIVFAELLSKNAGKEPLRRAKTGLASLPPGARSQVDGMLETIRPIIALARDQGFDDRVILWTVCGAILAFYNAAGVPQRSIDEALGDMVARINRGFPDTTVDYNLHDAIH